MSATLHSFLAEPMSRDLRALLGRLARTPGVVRIAVMPDAHASEDVAVGTVTATEGTILPAAVGGDIGCGMVTARVRGDAERLSDPSVAAEVLAGLGRRIPPLVFRRQEAPVLPPELADVRLTSPALERTKEREGRTELGTIGRGNHFVEIQRDEDGAHWVLVHSGSRAMGQAIRAYHEKIAPRLRSGLHGFDAEADDGRRYLADAAWAIRYAIENRRRILRAVQEVVADVTGLDVERETTIELDHNHVRRELHGGRSLWVHRKGAMGLAQGELGIVPGSMGSTTHHVEGRGHPDALCSSAHGAGRSMSRAEARRRISVERLDRETAGVVYDRRIAHRLCEEAPGAYKDVGRVMRAQRDLVRIVRRLQPVLVYKAP